MLFPKLSLWHSLQERKMHESGLEVFQAKGHRLLDELPICFAFSARYYLPRLARRFIAEDSKYKIIIYFYVPQGLSLPESLDWQEVQAENKRCNLEWDTDMNKVVPIDSAKPIIKPPWPRLLNGKNLSTG